jgi:hypothetical protein
VFIPESLTEVLRRTLRTYRPVTLAHKGSAWHGIYVNAPCWWFNPGGKVVRRWLGPTQVARIILDPSWRVGQARLSGRLLGWEFALMLPKSRHWYKLDGRNIMRARQRRAEAARIARLPYPLVLGR